MRSVFVSLSALVVSLTLPIVSSNGQTVPRLAPPGGQPITAERIELGRKLFFDRRVSADGTVACATCHQPARGFTDGRPVAVGIDGRLGTRNSPTVIHAAFQQLQFHDQRTDSLLEQATQPLVNDDEMGNDSRQQVMNRLSRVPGYRYLFREAYGTGVTQANFAHAIAAFESTLVSFGAPIDRRLAGDTTALSPRAELGFELFKAANCMACHRPPHFRDDECHNTGVSFRFRTGDQGREAVLPASARTLADRRAFKTPTLREVARTGPYTHAGVVPTLEAMVDHYNRGAVRRDGFRDARLDSRVRPLNLSAEQQSYLVAFLREAFAGPNYPRVTEPALP